VSGVSGIVGVLGVPGVVSVPGVVVRRVAARSRRKGEGKEQGKEKA